MTRTETAGIIVVIAGIAWMGAVETFCNQSLSTSGREYTRAVRAAHPESR